MEYIYLITGLLGGIGISALYYVLHLRRQTRLDAVYEFKNRLHANDLKIIKQTRVINREVRALTDEELNDELFGVAPV